MKRIIVLLLGFCCLGMPVFAQSPELFEPGITPANNSIETPGSSTKRDGVKAEEKMTVPVFICPSPQVLSLTAGCNVVIPDLITGLTTVAGTPAVFQQFPAAGTVVPSGHGIGQNVLIRATDLTGHTYECNVVNMTRDLTVPTISCPPDDTFYVLPYECSQFALFDVPTYWDNCPGGNMEATIPRGNYLPLGTHTSTWTFTDQGGNKASCSFKITIMDRLLPKITCPYTTTQTRTVNAGSCAYLVHGFEFDATGSDNCSYTQSYTLSGATTGSGTSLAGIPLWKGTTTILWTITDNSGNTATCSFDVVVGSTSTASIPDAFAYSSGVDANTIYVGWEPASKLTYTATASGGGSPYSFSWSAAPGLSIIGASNLPTVQVTSTTPGVYLLSLTVTDGNGCELTVTKPVSVVDIGTGTSMSKVFICKAPPGSPNNPVTISVAPNAVANLLGSGAFLGPCPILEARFMTAPGKTTIVRKPEVSLMPNPSNSYFNLLVTGATEATAITLRIFNINGQLMEARNLAPLNRLVQFGSNYKPGIYMVELMQDGEKTKVLIVKQ